MLPQLDRCSKNCVRMCAIYQHKLIISGGGMGPIILAALSTLYINHNSHCEETKQTKGSVSPACTRAMKIPVQTMYFF